MTSHTSTRRHLLCSLGAVSLSSALPPAFSQLHKPRLSDRPASAPFSALALFSTKVEADHVEFARQAIDHFTNLAAHSRFTFEATTDWAILSPATFAKYNVVLWLNDFPQTPAQRSTFEQYMEAGGAWLGFHIAAYNDSGTRWPWFLKFLGGGVFNTNSWPPLPAVLTVDNASHPVTRGIPHSFASPANEWYLWQPSPRANPDIDVLLTLSPANYPLGFKDVLTAGDLPVVWTNRRYRMLYMNMGHGDKIFSSPIQNQLMDNGLFWLGGRLREPSFTQKR